MDANQLLYYLRGFFENVPSPTVDHMLHLRNAILQAKPVEVQLIPIEVENPIKSSNKGDCGCGKAP